MCKPFLPVCSYVVCQGLAFVGLVVTVGAVELEYAGVRVLAVLHLVKPHVPMPALIAPGVHLSNS